MLIYRQINNLIKENKKRMGRFARMLLAYLGMPIPPPLVIMIEATNRCNAQCVICPREKMEREQGVMTLELFKKIIDEALSLNVHSLHLHNFGEPLLDPLIAEKIDYATGRKLRTFMLTNGSLLDRSIAEKLILAKLDRIKISLHGFSQVVYEVIHRGLKLETVEENIRNLISLKKELKVNKPHIEIQTLLCKETVSELKQFCKKWSGLVDDISIIALHNYSDGRTYMAIDTYNKVNICPAPFTDVEILWNGDVIPCSYDFNGSLKMGNVYKNSLKEIWNNRKFRHFRRMQLTRMISPGLLCGRCHRNRAPALEFKQAQEMSIFNCV